MNSKFLRLAALIAAAQYTLALPQPITHGTGHYATQIARADSAGGAGIPGVGPLSGGGVGSIVAGIVNTVGSVVGGLVPGGLPGGATVPGGLPGGGTAPGGLVPGSLVPGGLPVSGLVPGGLVPRGLPVGGPGGLHVIRDILTSDTPTPNPPSQAPGAPALPVVNPREISTSNILQNGGAAGPQEPPKAPNDQAPPQQKGHEEIYHVERAEKKLHAANPQCPPDQPNCDLSASSGSSGSLSDSTKTKLRRQVAVSGAGANPEPKAAVPARDSKVALDKTPLRYKRDNAVEGALPLPLPLPNVPLPTPGNGSSDPLASLVATVQSLLASVTSLLEGLTALPNVPALPAAPGAPAPNVGGRSFVDRQVHNADYSSDDGPSGNPPPSPSSAQPQPSATAVPKSTAET